VLTMICERCSGTGEGRTSDSTCRACKGRGELIERDWDRLRDERDDMEYSNVFE
jgi:DnaJ-class molecular chaperone